ncbi:hypothetical protein Salat_2980000 [Sesamum alatum]|uniref:Uncharacterized protein n=1 Tax=Sesamum alatum TaxID=300844 RepID=A0AAE1XIC1_9LAMI|nr:hypothetical protein Salat_2980000 [Sesamum alatum]
MSYTVLGKRSMRATLSMPEAFTGIRIFFSMYKSNPGPFYLTNSFPEANKNREHLEASLCYDQLSKKGFDEYTRLDDKESCLWKEIAFGTLSLSLDRTTGLRRVHHFGIARKAEVGGGEWLAFSHISSKIHRIRIDELEL